MNENYFDYATLEQLKDYTINVNKMYTDYYKDYKDYGIYKEKEKSDTLEEFMKAMQKAKPKEEQWLEQLEEMDITIVEQFLRRKKLERIKDLDKK